MPGPTSYYEALGVERDATTAEIQAAYNRWVGEFKKATTPPDPRREAMLDDALEVLSDPQRRRAYDAELAEAGRRSRAGRKSASPLAIAGVALVVVAAGAWFAFRSIAPTGPKARTAEELLVTMSGSVSALVAYDISGKSTPAGLAFVIEDKVMVASCGQLQPGVQLMVAVGKRAVPARVSVADDKLGLCKILTDSYVGEPLKVAAAPPAVGAKLFAATVDAKGEVGLKPATVSKVVDGSPSPAIEASGSTAHGAPLLDGQGKVVAVAALQPDGKLVHRVVPAVWLAENRPRVEEARPYQGGPSVTPGSGSAGGVAVWQYAPPPENMDYGCDCDFSKDKQWVAEREERWKKISELPPAEREVAAKKERMAEEFTRKTMKDMNERLRRNGTD